MTDANRVRVDMRDQRDPRATLRGVLASASSPRTRDQLARGSLGTLALRATSLALGMLAILVLARQLGPSEVGTYAWALAVAGTLQLGATFGLDRLATREVASMLALRKWDEMSALLRRGPLLILATSLVICATATVVGLTLVSSDKRATFLVALGLVPIFALTTLRQGALTGLGRVVAARLPEDLIRPALFLAMLALFWGIGSVSRDATVAMAMQAASAGTALVIGAVLLQRAVPGELRAAASGSVSPSRLMSQAFPLALISGASVLLSQLDIILLGILAPGAEVGLYAISYRLAQLVGLAEYAVNAAFMPVVSRLFAQGDREALGRGAPIVAAAALSGAILLALPPLLFPTTILSLFGEGFKGGETQLRLLAVSYVVSAGCGQNGTILTMTRRNRPVIVGTVVALTTNLALNAILIPLGGGDGAAVAWLATTVVWNVWLALEVRRTYGFSATPLTLLSRRWRRESDP